MQEYLGGSDPTQPANYVRIVSHSLNPPRTLAFVTFTSSSRRVYRLEASTDLTNWTPSLFGWFTGLDSLSSTIQPLPGTLDRYFYRIAGKRPLTP